MTAAYSRVAAWRRRQMHDLRLQYRNECSECGSTERLEFAHRHGMETVRGRNRGGRSAVIYDIRKNPLNYRLLCRECHREYDSVLELETEQASGEQLEAALTDLGFVAEEVRP